MRFCNLCKRVFCCGEKGKRKKKNEDSKKYSEENIKLDPDHARIEIDDELTNVSEPKAD